MIKLVNKMFYRFKFIGTTILSLMCFSEGLLFINPSFGKNISNPNMATAQNKQLSAPDKVDTIKTFDSEESIPEGYQRRNFEEQGNEIFNTYRLDFGDSISVTVERFPEFNFSAVLDGEGNILVPLLGRMSAKGLTLEEVETKVSYELGRRFLQENPQVFAFLGGQRPVNLTVIGEVFKPGYYNIGLGTPISAVLAIAGGSTKDADLRSIVIKRTLIDGTVIEEKLDLYNPLIQGKKEPNIRLQAGDTVIVSKLEVGQDRDYDQVFVSRTTLPQQGITVRIVSPLQPAGVALRNVILPNGSTFLDAVAQLPQFSPLITKEDVTLMRFDPEAGKVVTQTLNVVKTIENGDITQNVPLRDGDVIIVSRTLLGKFLAGIRVLTQPIRDIFGFTNFIENTFDNNNN